jgi:hypothetical protein
VTERWREPLPVIEANPHPLELVQMPDGRVLRGAEIILARDGIERIRLGLACGRCFEPFEASWPERCPVCGYAVRREQADWFAREFAGEIRIGPRTSLEDEAAGIRERAEREGV